MATQTINYNLIKPIKTENYDINVQNENMNRIDIALKTNTDDIATKETPAASQAKADAVQTNLNIHLADTATHGVSGAVVGTTNTQILTNKTLTSPKIPSGSSINDANGNELISFPTTITAAVNEITVYNASTTNTPGIAATGSDTNIGLNLYSKGVGLVKVYVNNIVSFVVESTNSAVNYLKAVSYPSGGSPRIEAAGLDPDININISPKGAGKALANGVEIVTISGTQTLSNKTLADVTMAGTLVAQSNTNYTTPQARNIILSTSDPSGGGNGDIWLKYTP